jgi:hypothetical protein
MRSLLADKNAISIPEKNAEKRTVENMTINWSATV